MLKQPPHSAESEKSVLGAILRSPEAFDQIADTLTPEDFYIPAHQTIYAAAAHLYHTQQPIDPVTVSDALQRTNQLNHVGGALFLSELLDAVPSAANIAYYANTVSEHAGRRALKQATAHIDQQANEYTRLLVADFQNESRPPEVNQLGCLRIP